MSQERVDADEDAGPSSDDEEIDPPSPNFWPTKQQLIHLRIAYHKCGHSANRHLARIIKLGNGKPDLVK